MHEQCDLNDHGNLVRCVKLVDIVISALSADLHLEQHKIIKAIKEAGNIKRFLPSEFGFNVDRNFIEVFLHPHDEAKDEVIVYGTGKIKDESSLILLES
ncbi:hypothetical protein QJS10_CPB12g00426 [Acorus calamus]|uniref:NmrA-like domain-containing protein n=1 Tax=Acorus calamus TaxID=4465 RepID=A0AAV9DRH0_ACOCL|nr:hypothetical protein QJS10_CPB12g00426 [Acorus calamus]